MTIPEAIKFIVDRKDDSLLKDSNKFKAYLKDLCADNPKELKIINRALEDKILDKIFGNDRDNVKIAKLRDEFEDQGMSEIWSEFIISSFAQVLGWNYELKETNNVPQEITYTEVALDKTVLEQLGYKLEYGDFNYHSDCQNKDFYNTKIIKNNNNLTSIDIPSTYTYNGTNYIITSIAPFAFNCFIYLEKIKLPESIQKIGIASFQNCKSLENINIPNNVYKIEHHAFSNCKKLEEINIPYGIKIIDEYTFTDCQSLETIELPTTITNIKQYAFSDCKFLEKINLPYELINIGDYAFENCKHLENLEIPNSVTNIGYNAFYGIQDIKYEGSASGSPWGAKNNEGEIIEIPTTEIIEITLTRDILQQFYEIGIISTNNWGELRSINIPEDYTYNGTTYKIISLGENCYVNSNELLNLNIFNVPNDWINAEQNSPFNGCTLLESVIIPDSVTKIGGLAFSGCTSLESIIIPDSVTEIEAGAFTGCTSLKSVMIPDSVTKIGGLAFGGCTSLKEITIPDSVTEIGAGAFGGCTSLKEITIPNRVTKIEAATFGGCTSLESIKISNNVTKIGSLAFRVCTSLENIRIPNGVTEIESEAFTGCTSLEAIKIPDSVTEIGYNAFQDIEVVVYDGSANGSPWGAERHYRNDLECLDGLIYEIAKNNVENWKS